MRHDQDNEQWLISAEMRRERDRREFEAFMLDIELMRISAQRMQLASEQAKEHARFAQSVIESSRSLLS